LTLLLIKSRIYAKEILPMLPKITAFQATFTARKLQPVWSIIQDFCVPSKQQEQAQMLFNSVQKVFETLQKLKNEPTEFFVTCLVDSMSACEEEEGPYPIFPDFYSGNASDLDHLRHQLEPLFIGGAFHESAEMKETLNILMKQWAKNKTFSIV